MNLLIVDDHAINRKLLRAQLEAEGHRVLDAANGTEALEVLDRENVDGVISDILMPVMDGFRLCLEIRKRKNLSRLPFVFYTSTYTSPQDRELARSVGSDQYLTKPSATHTIIGALEEAMQKTRDKIAVSAARHSETEVLKQYSEALVRKLEERNAELEGTLKSLQAAHEAIEASEERFRQITENIREVFWLTDPSKNEMLHVSPAYELIWGRPRDALYSSPQSWLDAIHPEDRDRVLRAAVNDQTAGNYDQEYRIVRPDGALRWIHDRAFPVRNAAGEVYRIAGVAEDITDRKLAAESLRESERRVSSILGTVRLISLMLDRNAQITYVNDFLLQLTGWSRNELIGQSWFELFVPPELVNLKQVFANLIANKPSAWHHENEIMTRSGERRLIRWNNTVLRSVSGDVIGTASIGEDITERKLQELKIERLTRVRAVSSAINSAIVRARDRQELFYEACRIAVEHGRFGIAWIGEINPEALEIRPVASAGLENSDFLMNTTTSLRPDSPQSNGVIQRAVRERSSIYNNDITVDTEAGGVRWAEAIRRGYRSAIGLPFIVDGAVVATFSVFAKELNFFDDEEVGLLTELASNISFGLEHFARQHRIEKLSRIRAVMGEINSAIVRIRDRQALFEEVCRIAAELGSFTAAWIGMIDPATREVRHAASVGLDQQLMSLFPFSTSGAGDESRGTISRALDTRKPVWENDFEADPDAGFSRRQMIQRGYRGAISLPLLVDEDAQGVLVLYARERGYFTEDEVGMLTELAADVSFALQSIAQQEKLDYLSYYDAVTRLPNRTLFMDRAGQQMRSRGGEPLMVALVVVNLERFRNINETFGRQGGDTLLKLVAGRLETAFHGKDYIARIGADNFGVVMRSMRDATAVVHAVESQILACFREPFKLDDTEVRVAARAGIAMYPADAADVDTLFANAEAALKKARASRERLLFYATDMNARAAQFVSLETRLRKAVELSEFVLHYQPKVSLSAGALSGLEALIRWQEPGAGLVAPGAFIPLLEETGLILPVGKWAIGRALADHREWSARGWKVPRIAVNVSAIQLQQHEFADMVIGVVQEHGDIPDALELEITESMVMRDAQASIRKLSILRGLGVHIAMDDFGTGYSSLSYLARLPINTLKIDRSFITNMASSPQDMAIVTTIIALAHSLNLKVTAEGVETEEQARLLRLLKCDEAQGYLFSKPLPAVEIEATLKAGTARPPARSGDGG